MFPVHGLGGALGTILAGVFASSSLGIFIGQGDGLPISEQVVVQLIGVGSVGVYTAILTFVLLKVIDALMGLRVSEEEETEGLDINQHNERGYDM